MCAAVRGWRGVHEAQLQQRRLFSSSAGDTTESEPNYTVQEHLQEAERLLREEFGPHAKIVATKVPSQRGPVEHGDGDDVPPTSDHFYRVGITFRLLGFPVELVSAKGRRARETIEEAMRQALSSDVEFIQPQSRQANHRGQRQRRDGRRHHRHPSNTLSPHQLELKAVLDELRELCVHFSRSIKLSIKTPVRRKAQTSDGDFAAESEEEDGFFRCRAYMRDEWSIVARMAFAIEERGRTPNEALMRCVSSLRGNLKAELLSDEVMLEGVREVEATVAVNGQHVTASLATESEGGGGTSPSPQESPHNDAAPTMMAATYSASLRIEDVHGNVELYQSRRQPNPYAAYQSAALFAIRSEQLHSKTAHLLHDINGGVPLIIRLRWQFHAMLESIAAITGRRAEEVGSIELSDVASSPASETDVGAGAAPPQITATFFFDGSVVWQESSAGRYRVEFDAYVQALYYLLDQYADVTAVLPTVVREGHYALFATSKVLESAVARHDHFNVLTNHKGKWNCYALLGTLTSQLMGAYYQTTNSFDASTSSWTSTLTIADGESTTKVLSTGTSKQAGEAWRLACLHAIRENWPKQYAAVLREYPDVDLSSDTMARGRRYRALPREKRVRHIGSLFSLVAAFAEEDLGWHQLRIRLRNIGGDVGFPQWVAEMEAEVLGEDRRRTVAVSPPYAQSKQARRVLTYHLAKTYFPQELEWYVALDRDDAINPELDPSFRETRIYQPGSRGFISQLFDLMEKENPFSGPFSWHITELPAQSSDEGRMMEGEVEQLLEPLHSTYVARVMGNHGDLLVAECSGSAGVEALTTALKSASKSLGGANAETLWAEFETYAIPNALTTVDLSLHLFQSFFGSDAVASADAVVAPPSEEAGSEGGVLVQETLQVHDHWATTVRLPCLGGVAISRAYGTTKKRSSLDAVVLAARLSFPRRLQYLVKHDVSCSSIAAGIVTEPIISALPPPVAEDIRRALHRGAHKTDAPLSPYKQLLEAVEQHYGRSRRIRMEQARATGGDYQCRLYLQLRKSVVEVGDAQLIGFGAASTAQRAVDVAAVMAVRNLSDSTTTEEQRPN